MSTSQSKRSHLQGQFLIGIFHSGPLKMIVQRIWTGSPVDRQLHPSEEETPQLQ